MNFGTDASTAKRYDSVFGISNSVAKALAQREYVLTFGYSSTNLENTNRGKQKEYITTSKVHLVDKQCNKIICVSIGIIYKNKYV